MQAHKQHSGCLSNNTFLELKDTQENISCPPPYPHLGQERLFYHPNSLTYFICKYNYRVYIHYKVTLCSCGYNLLNLCSLKILQRTLMRICFTPASKVLSRESKLFPSFIHGILFQFEGAVFLKIGSLYFIYFL